MTSIEIRSGEEAQRLLADRDFRAQWDALAARCPWATVFQTRGFVTTWYDVYRMRFEPVLTLNCSADGALAGLLTLALSRDGARLVVAGTHHAEYQAWLALPDDDSFIGEALDTISQRYPTHSLQLKYVPPDVPLAALTARRGLARRMTVVARRRPMVRLVDAHIEEIFRKSHNRSRINQLKRLGELKFERLRDVVGLERHFDAIIDLCDFRHGAAHGVLPFAADNLKREFHRRLMADYPELVHAVALTCGGELIGGHYGFTSGTSTVHAGILVYSPLRAAQSPGRIALMYLLRQLRDDGIKAFDLTPGGDSWKEQFATYHDTVFEATVRPSAIAQRIATAREQVLLVARAAAARFGLTRCRLTRALDLLRHPAWTELGRRLTHFMQRAVEMRVYGFPLKNAVSIPVSEQTSRDHIADLLKFVPVSAHPWRDTLEASAMDWPSKPQFLATAMSRIERGEHFYTIVADGRLAHLGWLVEQQGKSQIGEMLRVLEFSKPVPVLYDFYTISDFRKRGYYQRSITTILRDLAASGHDRTFIMVLADNAPSRHVIDKVGFAFYCSIFQKRRLGRPFSWSIAPSTVHEETWRSRRIWLDYAFGPILLMRRSIPGITLQTSFLDESVPLAIPLWKKCPSDCEAIELPDFKVDRDLPRIRFTRSHIRYVTRHENHYFIDIVGTFDDYIKNFSKKPRDNLRRSVRKFAELSGGDIRWTYARTPKEMEEFRTLALRVAKQSYQSETGWSLPESEAFRADMLRQADAGRVRGYLLLLEEEPIAYAFCRIKSNVIIYSIIGYDNRYRERSPGTVLLYLILQKLFREGDFRYFDFGGTEYFYKSFFATGSKRCARVIYLRWNYANVMRIAAHFSLLTATDIASRTRRLWRNVRSPNRSPAIRPVSQHVSRIWRQHVLWRCLQAIGSVYDHYYNVDTSRCVALGSLAITSKNRDQGQSYEPTSWGSINNILKHLPSPLDPFTFVDYGSGKGRVILAASRFPFRHIVGVEFAEQLCECARSNIASLRRMPRSCTSIEIVCTDATQFPVPAGPCILFFFNPFSFDLVDGILRRVSESYRDDPRPIYVIFYRMFAPDRERMRRHAFLIHQEQRCIRSDIFFAATVDIYAITMPPSARAKRRESSEATQAETLDPRGHNS